jgi:hypothetical protein
MKQTLAFLIIATILAGCTSPMQPSTFSDSGWISLFNGTDLSGWHIACLGADKDKTFWTVNDGAIQCDSMGKPDHNHVWLVSDSEYKDFHLRLKFQAFRSCKGNSGVQFRSRYDHSPMASHGGWLDGPQVDLNPRIAFRTGLIYDETQGVHRWIHPSLKDWNMQTNDAPAEACQTQLNYADENPEAWNTLKVICEGMNIQTFVNGRLISRYDATGTLDDENHKARNVGTVGHLALQLHMSHEVFIRFKDIEIRKK